jgi:dihydrofolate reductase/thymidylate synthase
MELMYNVVFCTDSKGGISKDGNIPWNIKEDSQYFRDLINLDTSSKKNIFIMGRKTFEKMNGLIKDNITLVVTNQPNQNNNPNIINLTNLNVVIDVVKNIVSNNNINKIFVLGGSGIYNYFFKNYYNYNMIIYWNLINKDYNCDNYLEHHVFTYLQTLNYLINDVRITCVDNNNQEQVELIVNRPFNMNKSIKIIEIINNSDEENYLRLMRKLLEEGIKEKCRNGYTRSLFGNILEFNLDRFPLLTTKKTFLPGIFEELMFFIKGQTNAKILSNKGVKIWDKNTSKNFLEKCGLDYEEGDMGPMYGFQWRHFNAQYNGMNYDYSGCGYDQLSYVLDLLKTDPKSRRILLTTYNPSIAKQGVLFPCHGVTIMFHTNFITDTELTLDIMQTQRSCDYFLGVPFNIASYSLLVYMICHVLNNDETCKYKYKPGKLVMNLGDYHLYEEHLEQAKRQILRAPFKFPQLNIKNKVLRLEDFNFDDIELIDYQCYPGIKAEMIE